MAVDHPWIRYLDDDEDEQTITFLVMQGTPQPKGLRLEPFTRPGVEGTAFAEDAERADGVRIHTSEDLADLTDLADRLDQDLKGRLEP